MAVLVIGSGPGAAQPPLSGIKLPDGFSISVFHGAVTDARSLAQGPGGTVFVGTRFAGAVWALVDENNDGAADQLYQVATGLDMPNGVAFRNGSLYVAEATRILRYDNIESQLSSPPSPVEVLAGLPTAPNHEHRWRYIRFAPDGRLHVAVGAPCDICESDDPYASILRLSADGAAYEVLARGVRNALGFDWHPTTRQLWFTDNGRNYLGEDSPPDELNVLTAAGQHFGFPYCHGSVTADPVFGSQRTCSEFQAPVQALGPHVAALGMRFYTKAAFPARYRRQIFIAEHGSWNRMEPIGYRIMLVRLGSNGRPVAYEEFATGWLQDGTAWGRPVDVMVRGDGSLLVSDDHVGAVYRIAYGSPRVDPPDSNPPPPGGGGGGGGGGFGGGGARNQAPEATEDIAEQVLDVGAAARLDLTDHFRDPEGRDMTFVAESTDTAIATVTVTDDALAVQGVAHGATTVTVTATDHRGLTATQTFDVTVGWTLGFATTEATAAEGDSATLTIALNRVRETDTIVAYVVGADADPATADADAADHDATDGMLTIAAGALEATLAIAVHDDADIEPAREWFTVTLQPSATDPPPWGLGTPVAHVAVAEGVCDRTRQVRNALRRSLPCDAVDDADLAAVRTLDVSGTGLQTLQTADLLQLDGLLRLDLSDNLLTELPAGLFLDLGNLVEVQAHDNPGAPFALGLTLHRVNGAPWAPGPAHVVLRVREGAPFEFQADVTATAGRPSRERVRVAAGRDDHWRFWVWREGRGVTRVSAMPTDVPATRCGAPSDDYPCFQGLTLPPPEPLALFKRPPRLTGDPPEPEVGTSGDRVRIDLGKLFRGAERDEPLTCAATVDDADLVTATLDGCVLTLTSSDDGDDGATTVTLTVTDADGQTTTLTFEVAVTPLPRGVLRGVRRVILLAPDDD